MITSALKPNDNIQAVPVGSMADRGERLRSCVLRFPCFSGSAVIDYTSRNHARDPESSASDSVQQRVCATAHRQRGLNPPSNHFRPLGCHSRPSRFIESSPLLIVDRGQHKSRKPRRKQQRWQTTMKSDRPSQRLGAREMMVNTCGQVRQGRARGEYRWWARC